jgi:hypothetical protein
MALVTPTQVGGTCGNCMTWGTPGERHKGFIVRCSGCGLYYWPHLGVNLPAGCATAVGSFQTIAQLSRMYDISVPKEFPVVPQRRPGWWSHTIGSTKKVSKFSNHPQLTRPQNRQERRAGGRKKK